VLFKLEKYAMKSLTRLAILAVVLAANLGCQSRAIAGLTANDEASLRQILDNEMKAANARDAAAWAAVYTEDAIVLRPHAPAVEGREAIQKWLATLPSISNAKAQGVEAWKMTREIYNSDLPMPTPPPAPSPK
jgi:SnoaL-like domain